MFPERFSNLPAYAFPRLRSLLDAYQLGGEGMPALLEAASAWAARRYGVTLDPATRVMALNGTREGLYNAMMALCPETKRGGKPIVLVPNPFYQVYMVAALSVGAEPMFLNATQATGHLPDFDAVSPEVLDRVGVVYMCSPWNPQGAVATRDYWANLIRLAEKHDFRIFADECYSEIYRDAPPEGVLQVAQELGADPERIVTFHSLSKRSNLPGLRSGFVVADPESIRQMKQLRNYAGSSPEQKCPTVWCMRPRAKPFDVAQRAAELTRLRDCLYG